MFGFIGFLFILFLLILLIGFSILGNLLRLFFGFGRRDNDRIRTYADPNQHASSAESHRDTPHHSSPGTHKQKIFGEDEGEYVDYEEVK